MTARPDPGLQPERTELAWRRTLLAIAVGALISVRVLAPLLGDAALLPALLGLVAAGVLWVLASRRHRAVAAVFLRRAPAAAMPGGALLLALTLLTASAAVLGLLLALTP